MKILAIFFSFFLVVSSCSESDPEDKNAKQVPLEGSAQKWELVRMTGSMINSETVGDDMDWQEYYILRPDSTFLKQREHNGGKTTATGFYKLVEQEKESYFELTFETGKELVASCSGNGKETLMFTGYMLYSTWNACDGPGLEYRLAKE
ncbi:hypothetical protein HME9304_01103 [Flagellimonas maritima]|uniref:Lipocalin-like domain-containing protein n=1 Tax=Flagellimonas maritima TaxID=1383885 RepID=A0A2Z4LQN4_9FLAO|nr:hypothetical protein [Allomuricauda aurantiaca]AWX44103.1 hypothetical protein HME9304_01103 [Allomuricauda aurantiaca]